MHCRPVATPAELSVHLRIRERVFVDEQAIFTGTDRDERDADPATIHVLGFCDGEIAGTVRLYALDEEGVWLGDRLAVLPAYRARHVAAPLVRFAVRSAGERGGRLMRAHVQVANVRFFRRLGWIALGGPADYLGRPHQDMVIELGV
ncbi:MAG: GNAT family N-acetyltransferase [Chloroflexi bacterium]|nr:MAG: GNAT family N-acetyltransferase [Chloroflexota bacterium]